MDEDGDELGGGEAMLAAKRRLFRCWSVSEDEDEIGFFRSDQVEREETEQEDGGSCHGG